MQKKFIEVEKKKQEKGKRKWFGAILEIDMLQWLKLAGKLSKASSELLIYFRPSDLKFYMEIVSF